MQQVLPITVYVCCCPAPQPASTAGALSKDALSSHWFEPCSHTLPLLADGHEGPGRDLNGGSQRGGTAAGAALGTPAAIPAVPGGSAAGPGDLYRRLLEAVCMLVTDPHPQVVDCATAVLRVADVELTVMPVSVSLGALPSRPKPCVRGLLTSWPNTK